MNDLVREPDFNADSSGKLTQRGGLSLADAIEIVMAHFWPALALGLLAGAAAAWALLSQIPVHEARSVLLIQLGRDYAYVPETPVTGLRTPDPGDLETYVNAEIQLLNSSAVVSMAFDKLRADGILKPEREQSRADGRDQLSKAVTINLITGSYLVDIRARDIDGDRAGAIVKAFVASYLEQRIGMIGADRPAFLGTEVDNANQKLADIEAAFVARTGSASFEAHDLRIAAVGDNQRANDQDLAAAHAEVAGLTARLTSLQRLQAPEGVAASPKTDRAAQLLVEAEANLAQATAALEALKATASALLDEQAKLDAAVPEVSALRTEAESVREALKQLRAQLAASEIAAARNAAGLGTVRVIEDGLVGDSPVGMPDRLKIVAASLLGILATLLAILILEMRSAHTHTASIAVRRFGVPVLGEVTWRRYGVGAGEGERT